MTGLLRAVIVVTVLFAMASPAVAHEFGASRQVLVSIDEERIEMLVLWELGSSSESRMFDALLDANRDGILDGVLERFAAVRTLMPLALQGLGLTINGEAPAMELVRSSFAPGNRADTTAGWVGGVLLRAEWNPADACQQIRVVREEASPAVSAVIAEVDELRVVDASMPRGRDGDWTARLPEGAEARWCVARPAASGPDEQEALRTRP